MLYYYLILNIKWPTRSLVQALIKTRISDLIKIIINIINYCNNTQDNLTILIILANSNNILIYLIQIGIFCFIQMLNNYYVLLPYYERSELSAANCAFRRKLALFRH